jgi:L-threonylcarbamoyladenylate synthase
MQSDPIHPKLIDQAVSFLKQGQLVAFPTETVYGLGGDAENPAAIRKIFEVKGRSLTRPLSLLIPNTTDLTQWADTLPPIAQSLAHAFWPGPLTLIVPPRKYLSPLITAGRAGVGLRVPDHPIAQALLQAWGGALAAPSANLSGHFSPTRAAHVRQQLADKIPLILEGGTTPLGLESTVINLTLDPPYIVRLGAISLSKIQQVLPQQPIRIGIPSPRSSNPTKLHLKLITTEALVALDLHTFQNTQSTAILAYSKQPAHLTAISWIQMPREEIAYQYCFYDRLHDLNQAGYQLALIEQLPQEEHWSSLRARLAAFCQ